MQSPWFRDLLQRAFRSGRWTIFIFQLAALVLVYQNACGEKICLADLYLSQIQGAHFPHGALQVVAGHMGLDTVGAQHARHDVASVISCAWYAISMLNLSSDRLPGGYPEAQAHWKLVPAQMAGHIDTFADKVEPRDLFGFQCFGG